MANVALSPEVESIVLDCVVWSQQIREEYLQDSPPSRCCKVCCVVSVRVGR